MSSSKIKTQTQWLSYRLELTSSIRSVRKWKELMPKVHFIDVQWKEIARMKRYSGAGTLSGEIPMLIDTVNKDLSDITKVVAITLLKGKS